MFRFHRRRVAAGLVLALALGVGAAACSGDDDSSSSDTTSAATTDDPSATDATDAMNSAGTAGEAPFGPACAQVPTEGEGSVSGMADDPVATAASNNPLLSTLVSAVTAANLGDTLNSAENITVFAPINDAFAAVDPATLDAAMADPTGLLTTVLTYHVVPERLSPDQLAGQQMSLQGEVVSVEGSGEEFTVNGNDVVCGNVQTANATVYLIDGVLLPPSSAA
jgi:uncharacterized surface protein with fasciclin (FAS1) repeats